MSELPQRYQRPPPFADRRGLAMLGYGLLFVSVFFAGLPSLAAVAIAYSQKAHVSPGLRAHFRFQIALFWIVFCLFLVAGTLAVLGLLLAVLELMRAGQQSASTGFHFWSLHFDGATLVLIVCGVLLAVFDAALLLVCSVVGFIRLASDRSLSDQAS